MYSGKKEYQTEYKGRIHVLYVHVEAWNIASTESVIKICCSHGQYKFTLIFLSLRMV